MPSHISFLSEIKRLVARKIQARLALIVVQLKPQDQEVIAEVLMAEKKLKEENSIL